MKNLISMVDFVLSESKKAYEGEITFNHVGLNCEKYAKFLKQNLELWMFIPCDEEGNVIKEPYMVFADDNEECEDYIKLFCEAKDRVLFKGFDIQKTKIGTRYAIKKSGFYVFSTWEKIGDFIPKSKFKTIEDLVKYNLELTQTALKKIRHE